MAKPHPLLESGDGTPSLRPLYMLLPYLWPKGRLDLKLRVAASMACLLLAIAATAISPLLLGWLTDKLSRSTPSSIAMAATLGLIVAYAFSRVVMQFFAQMRDGGVAKVLDHALREVGVAAFAHVHTLSLRFHLERKTGGLSRVIERGTKGIDTILSFAIFNIFPAILQLAFYSAILLVELNVWVALST